MGLQHCDAQGEFWKSGDKWHSLDQRAGKCNSDDKALTRYIFVATADWQPIVEHGFEMVDVVIRMEKPEASVYAIFGFGQASKVLCSN